MSSWETDEVSQWLINTEPDWIRWDSRADALRDKAEEHDNVESGVWTISECVTHLLAAEIKEWFMGPEQDGVKRELQDIAGDQVSWYEVADCFVDEEV